MKKRSLIICMALILCGVMLVPAACVDDKTSDGLSKTDYPFRNLSAEYTIEDATIPTYHKEGSEMPYVELETFIAALDGLYDDEDLQSFVSEASHEYFLQYTGEHVYTMIANWEKDTIRLDSLTFLSSFEQAPATDYAAFLQPVATWKTGESDIVFDLGEYGFDILYYGGQTLFPFYIVNLLFCSFNLYNVYFNGEAYYGIEQGSLTQGMTAEKWAEIMTCERNDEPISAEMSLINLNFLNFTLDYFYGLKDYKNIGSFAEDVITGDLKEALLSSDNAVRDQAYIDLLQKTLDERHTALIKPSYYSGADAQFDASPENILNGGLGEGLKEAWQISADLNAALVAPGSDALRPVEQPDGTVSYVFDLVRFAGDTAIIYLDAFKAGSDEQIYNEDGTVSEDAMQHDTYFFMRYAMDRIAEHDRESETTTRNVVLDLAWNGGGSIAAMWRALGFLTDEPIEYLTRSTISGATSAEYYAVDADGDGDFTDDDAYDQYKWYVLTSKLSFSAANLFTAIAKEQGIATVIGERSGGGTCAVYTIVLPDGTTTNISSPIVFETAKYDQGVMVGGDMVESGVVPDIPLDRQYFYDNEALLNAIKGVR